MGESFVKLQTFTCWSFSSQPTPFFGAWRSTCGRSLFGMLPRWRAIKATAGSHYAAVLASVTAHLAMTQQLDIPVLMVFSAGLMKSLAMS